MPAVDPVDLDRIISLLEFEPKSATFKRDADHPIDAGAVIVDETSMLDLLLADALLDAIPEGTRLVLVGDVDQLPSVGPGAVLRDVIASGVVPTVRLTQIFRQSEGSLIVENTGEVAVRVAELLNLQGNDGAYSQVFPGGCPGNLTAPSNPKPASRRFDVGPTVDVTSPSVVSLTGLPPSAAPGASLTAVATPTSGDPLASVLFVAGPSSLFVTSAPFQMTFPAQPAGPLKVGVIAITASGAVGFDEKTVMVTPTGNLTSLAMDPAAVHLQ